MLLPEAKVWKEKVGEVIIKKHVRIYLFLKKSKFVTTTLTYTEMYRINTHPILPVPAEELVSFDFEGKTIKGQKGQTIAAALHQAGYPVHSLSLEHRNRTMECGIGKCGACEMLVDGKIRRICVTKVDGVRNVARLSADNGFKGMLFSEKSGEEDGKEVYRTTVAIIGAGPAGLAVREELRKEGVDCLVIDSNSEIGGQFLMQTHQFFFSKGEALRRDERVRHCKDTRGRFT